MKLYGEPHHALIAVGVVLGSLALGFTNKVVDKSEAKPDQTAVAGLTASDLRGTVRISSVQRQRAVSSCTTGLMNLDMRGRGTVRIEGSLGEFTQQRRARMTPICECLVEQIENRANGLQFRMFISFLSENSGRQLSTMPSYRQYWAFATANGRSDKEFWEMKSELESYIMTSSENCHDILKQ
jgi:hypothetical protein